ncbi:MULTISPECIES: NADP-dependent oxidoreductase [unclassified Streptomyces]|uniref:NADP-dependent oxidoreductase n=1 Tax=unclassified Streptomyces TaxID=2593676 RepID=UPI0008819385|nr:MULTISPECIES: NADP-dependent oxidoreductase [unclassified Streptomyces]PBC83720.1 NADPH:quinone reductase-like Zn-dependent oxidoreductase [Streptomyces sp. 2321.6]SDR39522.1 NADPH:quinone reductase [Streptomyces sp. KS_16]SED05733.1 NADPH:quinone reductase [Streptomyces sp. 2133.1]SNC69799.1 NADPH:quinone reductase [Streptomyces sp. 2114.4]
MSETRTPQMRAVSQDTAGGPDVLKMITTDRPVPGPTEVLVRVHAAGVNPTDWKSRAQGEFLSGAKTPFTLGFDVSGLVEAVGLGVTVFAPGDKVFGMPRFPHPAGAYAEYVTAPARHFAPLPASLDHLQGAALPLASLTAWQALVDTAHVQPGARVLVHAAAGGVGHLAVQIAKSRGAYVIGTARQAKHDFLRGLGADELVDYTQQDFAETVRDIDIVLDTIGGDYGARSLRTLRPGGTLVSILPLDGSFPAAQAREAGIRAGFLLVEPDQAGLRAVADLVNSGKLQVNVDTVLPLEEAAQAHTLGETGRTTGKIVLSVAP